MLLLSLSVFGQPVWSQTFASNRQVTTRQPAVVVTRNLKDVLQELKNRYRVDILVEGGLIENVRVTTGEIDFNQPVERNLGVILKSTRLYYKKIKAGSYLILTEKSNGKKAVSSASTASLDGVMTQPAIPSARH